MATGKTKPTPAKRHVLNIVLPLLLGIFLLVIVSSLKAPGLHTLALIFAPIKGEL
jgi:hypothetical protein